MEARIPEMSLVVMIGASGSGKSTFARRHFRATEIISSDQCRALVADDENDQSATGPAFEVLNTIASKRLEAGRLTVIDATSVRPEDRKVLVKLARQFHMLPVALVLDLPASVCHERNQTRNDRQFGPHVVNTQTQLLRRSLRHLQSEGFRRVHVFRSVEEVDGAVIVREPLWNNKKGESGPFDIIGDVHGCHDELCALIAELGYVSEPSEAGIRLHHPAGRTLVFVGDLVDRGPKTPDVLRLVMNAVRDGTAYCVAGNHDMKLVRKLAGRDVKLTHGLAQSVEQLERESPEFRSEVARFLDGLVSHYVFDAGRLVVAHAGLKEELQGRGSGAVREFAMYGETTGESDEHGLPVRYDWAKDYRGRATVVYGHTTVARPEWLNNTLCIDTGCVYGGRLTALRYPEAELVSVPARQTYYEPTRPLNLPPPTGLSTQQEHDGLLSVQDVLGKRIIELGTGRPITVREENSSAALEVMSRFAVEPQWLIYLPPTMSPSETHTQDRWLEHPAEAFAYYTQAGVATVMCEEKHMGSRAVVVVCRDAAVARSRFGVDSQDCGSVYTRTGRPFFGEDRQTAQAFLARVNAALEAGGIYRDLATDWVLLDCEIMPWSVKAQSLLQQQYAAVGAAGLGSLAAAVPLVAAGAARHPELASMLTALQEREAQIGRYVEAYRRYCWPTQGIEGLKLAPFHLLASEGALHTDKTHAWHLDTLARLVQADPELFVATAHRQVDVNSQGEVSAATEWWVELTQAGGEGMVVKPLSFLAEGPKGLLQPALKCRGREYLRIIYGPEYDRPEHLARLRHRGLSAKRSLALRELRMGLEGLNRFIRREPLRRVHECVFAVLALESEPVDPRL